MTPQQQSDAARDEELRRSNAESARQQKQESDRQQQARELDAKQLAERAAEAAKARASAEREANSKEAERIRDDALSRQKQAIDSAQKRLEYEKQRAQDEMRVRMQTNARTVGERQVAADALRNGRSAQPEVDLYRELLRKNAKVPRELRTTAERFMERRASDATVEGGPKSNTINTYSPSGNVGSDGDMPDFPFKLYVSDNKVRFIDGVHIWWDSYANAPTKNIVSDGGGWATGSQAIYVKREYNSDGTATVSVGTAATDSDVYSMITATISYWVVGVVESNGNIIQYQFGPISELRIA